MNTETVAALAEINRRFYRRFAAEFSASRERPWAGWDRLVDRLVDARAPDRSSEPLAVLDVGCGNGRFATYLTRRWPPGIRYLGLDNCGPLLDLAAERLQISPPSPQGALPTSPPSDQGALPIYPRGRELRLLEVDLVGGDLNRILGGERFDLIAVFGVLHHLPGLAFRRSLLRRLAQHLGPGGVLAASVWQHHLRHDFRRRVLPWPQYLEESGAAIEPDQLEEGDTLLTWGGDQRTPRYCHFPGGAEIHRWTADLDLCLAERFEADGQGGRENLYLVFETATARNPPCPTSE